MTTIAVFASGKGSNFEAILRKTKQGRLKASIGLVVASGPQAGIIGTARREKIPCHVQEPGETPERMLDVLRDHGIGLIVLAGYLKKLPGNVVAAFPNRILNIHPALLPAFGGKGCYGIRVHEKVIESGVKVTGVTVHFADNEYDQGPVILQKAVAVKDGDTPQSLQRRVLRTEHDLYWRAVDLVVRDRLRIEGRRVLRK
jgi:phosphoribosylglycinamide formyltransferase-1